MNSIRIKRGFLFFSLILLSYSLWAAITFPTLTGRVVDDAHIISTGDKDRLTQLLAQHEEETTNQIVVVTLQSLQGYSIEDYGYQLGRHWGIGQKGINNGVLLIVAPNERKVRIEVGYGLEGTLTDALSHSIIQDELLPQFRKQNYMQGIKDGVNAIIAALKGSYKPERKKSPLTLQERGSVFIWIFFIALVVGEWLPFWIKGRLKSGAVTAGLAFLATWLFSLSIKMGGIIAVIVYLFHIFIGGGGGRGGNSDGGYHGGYSSGGGYSGGGYSGGGFSGGGGSFGGGGASGGW